VLANRNNAERLVNGHALQRIIHILSLDTSTTTGHIVDVPQVDALILLQHVLDMDGVYIYAVV